MSAGCGPSASPASGITALLRVANAQFVEGALAPDSSAPGTAIVSGVAINNTNVYPGEQSFPLAGSVSGATVLVGLKNDAVTGLFRRRSSTRRRRVATISRRS